MAGYTDTSTLADSMQTYYDKLFLTVAKRLCVMDQFGQNRKHPKNEGKTVSFTRYTALAPATTALTESTNPSGKDLSDTAVTCTVYEYGDFTKISSLVSKTSIDPDISGKTKLFAQQAAETYDRLLTTAVGAGLTIQRASAVSALSDLASSDILDTDEIAKAVRTLKLAKAIRFADGYWVAVVNPYQAYDLNQNAVLTLAKEYAGSQELYKGEVGKWMGVRFVEATDTYRTDTDGTADYDSGAVHYCAVMGAESYGAVDLEKASVYLKTGAGDTSNPLNMFYTYGWKMTMGQVVLNSAFGVRIASLVG